MKKGVLAAIVHVLLGFACANASLAADPLPVPSIRAGAIELGLSGSLTTVAGSSTVTISTRSGTFVRAAAGLAGLEAELAYSHVQSLDRLDVQVYLSWQRPPGKTPLYPYVAMGGGIRQEWIGSFKQVRYPVGLSLGLRALVSQRVAFRTDYRFLRLLNDPVSNFSEHQITIGLSVFFRNAR